MSGIQRRRLPRLVTNQYLQSFSTVQVRTLPNPFPVVNLIGIAGDDFIHIDPDGIGVKFGGPISAIGGFLGPVTGDFTLCASSPLQTAAAGPGNGLELCSSDATAGTNAGAAKGGDVTITAGDAKRNTSGDAQGGSIILEMGSGIGAGVSGVFQILDDGGSEVLSISDGGLIVATGLNAGSTVKFGRTLPGSIADGVYSKVESGDIRRAFTTDMDAGGTIQRDYYAVSCEGTAHSKFLGAVGIGAGPLLLDSAPTYAALAVTGQIWVAPAVQLSQAWALVSHAQPANRSSFLKLADSENDATGSFIWMSSGNPADKVARLAFRDAAGFSMAFGKADEDGSGFVPLLTIDRDGNVTVAGITGRTIPLVVDDVSSLTPTIDVDTTDQYELSALTTDATFGAPTGTPVNGQRLTIVVNCVGVGSNLVWNAAFIATTTVALPAVILNGQSLVLELKYLSIFGGWVPQTYVLG